MVAKVVKFYFDDNRKTDAVQLLDPWVIYIVQGMPTANTGCATAKVAISSTIRSPWLKRRVQRKS